MAKDAMRAGYGVIGLGRFGQSLAKTLFQSGEDVLVIDENEDKVRQAREYADAAFVTGTLDKQTLTDCGVQNLETVIVAIGEKIDTSILATLTVIQLGVPRVIAKAISEDQGEVLRRLGAEVVYPESDMAVRLAKRLTSKRLLDFLAISEEVEITELSLCGRFAEKTVAGLDLRRRYGINIIAVVRGEAITTDITPEMRLTDGDAIIVIGRKEQLHKFEQSLEKEAP